jgi:hypothetical protein
VPELDESIAYQTTANELNVRIQLRDTILLALVAAAAAIIGVLIPLDGEKRRAALVVPFIGFIATLMIFHHDLIILFNARFLRELETRGTPGHQFWHSHGFYRGALVARLFFNISHVLTLILVSIVSLMLAGEQGPAGHELGWRIWYTVAIVLAVISCILAIAVGLLRFQAVRRAQKVQP